MMKSCGWLRAGITGLCLSTAAAESAAQQTPPAIIVSGSGEVVMTPDRATFVVSVESSATTAAGAGADNAKRHQAVIAALGASEVSADELASVGYLLEPTWRYNAGAQVRTGYRASNNVRVEVRQLDRIGPLIDAELRAGATGGNDVSYDAKEQDQARQQALIKAVAQARADADTMAKAAGGKLGTLLELSTYSQRNAPDVALERVAMAQSKRLDETTTGERTSLTLLPTDRSASAQKGS